MENKTNHHHEHNGEEINFKEEKKNDNKDEAIIKGRYVKSENDDFDEINQLNTKENVVLKDSKSESKSKKEGKDDENCIYELRIKCIKQSSTWDCGLACVKMILSLYNAKYSNFNIICNALEIGTSVWTIDLCYILKHYNIAHKFLTCTIGVDKNYAKEPFYKEYYDEDENRVNNLFGQAKSVGINIENNTVEISDIINHLKSMRPIIILVNWTVVKSQKSGLSTCIWPFFRNHGTYQGHFIVLTGCSEDGKNIFFLNPQKSSRKTVSSQTLDSARKAYGTDQDIIFITKKLHKSVLKACASHGDK